MNRPTTLNRKAVLTKLHQAINQDGSIQRYTLNWSNVTTSIERRYKNELSEIDQPIIFTKSLLLQAITVSQGSLLRLLTEFAKELAINVDTLHTKANEHRISN